MLCLSENVFRSADQYGSSCRHNFSVVPIAYSIAILISHFLWDHWENFINVSHKICLCLLENGSIYLRNMVASCGLVIFLIFVIPHHWQYCSLVIISPPRPIGRFFWNFSGTFPLGSSCVSTKLVLVSWLKWLPCGLKIFTKYIFSETGWIFSKFGRNIPLGV